MYKFMLHMYNMMQCTPSGVFYLGIIGVQIAVFSLVPLVDAAKEGWGEASC